MPKAAGLGNCYSSSKSGNGPPFQDHSSKVCERGQGKPPLHGPKEDRSNGCLSSSIPAGSTPLAVKATGKLLSVHAALQAHSSSTNGDPNRGTKSNGLLQKLVAHKDRSCQTAADQDISKEALGKNSFQKSAMEQFGRSFKEATINLVRTTEDLWAREKLSQKSSTKERLWTKPASEHKGKSMKSFQDSDGYCPDLELSDSEPEAKGRRRRQAGFPLPDATKKGKQSSRHSVKR
ncbi:hypothetical protein OJAV_G00037660 [Oryzias javanicus]|nr:hypothetical protein OJAV_G00037660 [Oryzias javanicus]